MSDKQQWAVYLDYGQEGDKLGIIYSIVLGGSIGVELYTRSFLSDMSGNEVDDMWEVDEDDLPYGYTFQTYYVARYYGGDVAK